MKCLLNPSLLSFLLVTTLSVVHGFDVDNLHYRQVTLRPTGASTTATQQKSPASTPTDATVAASPTSVVDISTSSSTSSAASVLTSATPDIATNSATATLSSSPETAATSARTSQTALTPASTTNKPQTTSKPSSSISTPVPVSSRFEEVLTTIVSVSGSTTYSNIITTSSLQAVTPTSTPPVGTGDNGPGLEPAQKRLIIGVVVGVGGAILMGGLAIVAWRIWGKRKEPADDDHELIDSLPGSSGHEKSGSLTGNSPFRSTLDQYHKPAGPVNTASNF